MTVVKTGAELAAEAKAKAPKAALVEEVKVTQKQKDPKEIWDEGAAAVFKRCLLIHCCWCADEVESAAELVDDGAPDDRKLPECVVIVCGACVHVFVFVCSYEILYKQKVTSEDVYLNMGFKDSSTSLYANANQ